MRAPRTPPLAPKKKIKKNKYVRKFRRAREKYLKLAEEYQVRGRLGTSGRRGGRGPGAILESLYIREHNPAINKQISASQWHCMYEHVCYSHIRICVHFFSFD